MDAAPDPDSADVPSEAWQIETHSLPLDVRVEPYTTGWQVALHRPPTVKTETPFELGCDLRVLSVNCRPPKVQVQSFAFPELPETDVPAGRDRRTPRSAAKPSAPKSPRRNTRLRPPNDTVKLSDRLYYLLQPPLESLVQASTLTLPFEPFPYQYEGIAFLYPRHAAVLADEMGLGKTMQAINTIRLLLLTGEAKRILLVCPKPLVTNWRREFSLWAPELGVTIIEGDRVKRQWQWQQVDSPLKIANYELLMRDSDLIDGLGYEFDLVVLDEAQRIKNRSSTTSQVARSIPRVRSWALTGTPVENSPGGSRWRLRIPLARPAFQPHAAAANG